MGQKVIIRFWWESELSSAFINHLSTFCRFSSTKRVVFRDSSLYPKQLCLYQVFLRKMLGIRDGSVGTRFTLILGTR